MDDQEVMGEEYENIKERASIADSFYESISWYRKKLLHGQWCGQRVLL